MNPLAPLIDEPCTLHEGTSAIAMNAQVAVARAAGGRWACTMPVPHAIHWNDDDTGGP